MSFEAARAMIQTVEWVGRLTTFGIHAVNDFIWKCKLDWPLNICLRGNGVAAVDQPYWHTHMEEVITDLRVVCKAAHPICADRRMRSRRIGNMRLYELDIVQECHDVEEVTLGLSYEDDYVTECQRVVEKEYSVMFK